MSFELISKFIPKGDQPEAIKKLVEGINNGEHSQVLLGATGTGKTFTISNVIQAVQKPTLVIVHNKTLAGQLYSEFKEFFPNNHVEYFISNFDFYQPEAYIPSRDLYIEKNAVMNMEIEMLRSAAVNAVLEHRDTIIVASVASIYALNDPDEYRHLVFFIKVGDKFKRKEVLDRLIEAQYRRNDIDLAPGTFRISGEILEIAPASTSEVCYRIEIFDNEVERISEIDPVSGKTNSLYKQLMIYPAYAHASRREKITEACKYIKEELIERIKFYNEAQLPLEKERIELRTMHDIESMQELGICPGIENYSMHIDGRNPGESPFSLVDYFPEDFLLVIDESHVTLPQFHGMYKGDHSRKLNLVQYGFRLPSALENRPLKFDEFYQKINQVIYVSATPGDFELQKVNYQPIEQIIRPTGLLDPVVEVRPSRGQVDDIIYEIQERIKNNERTLITTMTIRMAENLTEYLKKLGLKVAYLHSETKTLDRIQIIYELRKGIHDVLVGINLLREGLDLPEVSLICILDADKEGFLRSKRSLVQIIGRAARNINGKVIMYGDKITESMKFALDETNRRRLIQDEYNKVNNIIPQTIVKEVKEPVHMREDYNEAKDVSYKAKGMSKKAKEKLIAQLEKDMKEAARNLDFERAAQVRDILFELKSE